jgi:hypothetical protein
LNTGPKALGNAMANNMKTDWETDLAGIILDLWMEKMDPSYYVTVDQVQPQMAQLGYDSADRQGLGRAMGVIAADNSWQIRIIDMADEGTIQVLPIAAGDG